MRLVAIYNVWADYDLLAYSLKNIRPLVDGVIIIASERSNYGEFYPIPNMPDVYQHEPIFRDPRVSETDKRNFGLSIARSQGYTHFLTLDADEFYEPEPFLKEKERFRNNPDLKGLVCQCQTYFKSPQLTIGLDTTLVPFIHKLTPTIAHEFNRGYPHAWDSGFIRIDPTRSLNINNGVDRCDLIMHHFSYVRKDLEIKIRNSTARNNIQKSSIREDYANAKEGYYCKYYKKTLYKCENIFNLPELGKL